MATVELGRASETEASRAGGIPLATRLGVFLYVALPLGGASWLVAWQLSGRPVLALACLGYVVPAALVIGELVTRAARRVSAAWSHSLALSQRLAAVVDHVTDAIAILDPEGRVTYVNPAGIRLMGGAAAGQDYGHYQDFIHPDDRASAVDCFESALTWPGVGIPVIFRSRSDDGTWVSLEGSLVNRLDDPEVGGVIVSLADVTERRSYESRLIHQALHDPLTGLPNRVLLLDRIGQALRRAARSHAGPAVLFLDLDRFKTVNDTLGHGSGDELLVAVSNRVKPLLRDGDTLARFGGDEFAILCEEVSTDGEAAVVAQRIMSALSEPFDLDGREIFLGASIGVARAEPGLLDDHQLLADADAAMYRAKEKGRGRVEMFDVVLREQLRHRMDVENDLHGAVARGELEVHYQPVFTSDGRVPVSVEALVRWRRSGQLVAPNEFIPVAEETGLISSIDQFVLEMACRQLAAWDVDGPAGLSASVNLSPHHLASPTLVPDVKAILARTGIDPRRLLLEVTEGSFVRDLPGAQRALAALRELGVSVGVDDFGTGFSSLSYLRELPVDQLKIDRSFVAPLDSGDKDQAVVRAIVDLAHSLGLETVGEGVETPEQLAALRSLGCDYAQGFHLQRPVPPEELTLLARAAGAVPAPA